LSELAFRDRLIWTALAENKSGIRTHRNQSRRYDNCFLLSVTYSNHEGFNVREVRDYSSKALFHVHTMYMGQEAALLTSPELPLVPELPTSLSASWREGGRPGALPRRLVTAEFSVRLSGWLFSFSDFGLRTFLSSGRCFKQCFKQCFKHRCSGEQRHVTPNSRNADALAYIDAMDERRNVSKGQRAMVKAMRYPDAQHGGKRKKGSSLVSKDDFHASRISQARAVLHHSRSLAESVVKGITPLDAALARVRADVGSLKPEEGDGRLVQKPLIVRDGLLADMKTAQTMNLFEMTCRFEEVFTAIQRNPGAAKWARAAFVARNAGFHLHGPLVYKPQL
jgi:hypothetical protein